jgi:hypothetical protein
MAAACSSKDFYQTTWHRIPDDSSSHSHHNDNLKSHSIFIIFLAQASFIIAQIAQVSVLKTSDDRLK